MPKNIIWICLAIALLEGFAGLGIEIYAIRISAIYIGSSISITGIILALVLIAIAIGYWYGGRLSQNIKSPKRALSQAGFVLALSVVSHTIACMTQLTLLELITLSTDNPIIAAVGVGLVFGVGLAFGSMSIPLITQFLTLVNEDDDQIDAGKNAGVMVATTTIGSVLGSKVTPILLLPYIGLLSSLAVFIASLTLSAWLCTALATKYNYNLAKNRNKNFVRKSYKNFILSLLALAATLVFIITNKTDTGYQTTMGAWFINNTIIDGKSAVTISDMPRKTISSCWIYATEKSCSWYGKKAVEEIQKISSKRLIFLGGAGMAIPTEIAHKNPKMKITVIDIDKGLKDIVEMHFFKGPIAHNIKFVREDARGYLIRHKNNHYDYMLIDTFQGKYVAGNIYTIEALKSFKVASKYIMANIIGRPSLNHAYTQALLNTWQEAFGDSAFIITHNDTTELQNILLCNFPCGEGKQLSQAKFFSRNQKVHSDDLPILDRYYYQSL